MKTRLENLIALHVKWTKYLCKDFKLRLEKLTGYDLKWTKTFNQVLRFLKNLLTSKLAPLLKDTFFNENQLIFQNALWNPYRDI